MAKNAKNLQKGGKIKVYLDNRKIGEKSYTENDEDEIDVRNKNVNGHRQSD